MQRREYRLLVQKGTTTGAKHGRPLSKYAYSFVILQETITSSKPYLSNVDCSYQVFNAPNPYRQAGLLREQFAARGKISQYFKNVNSFAILEEKKKNTAHNVFYVLRLCVE